MIQEILVYAVVILAVLMLGKKFFKKSKPKKPGCDTDCNC